MPKKKLFPSQNSFEHSDPRAIVHQPIQQESLIKGYNKILRRPKTPPLKQSDVFEGVVDIKKSKKRKSRRKVSRAPKLR